jgi:two-component system chemotaxis sensor kinase CheA
MKGGAGMFGFADVADLTHEAETLLDRVRKGQLALTVEIVDAMLQTGDAVKQQLALHRGDDGAAPEVTGLIACLRALANGEAAPAAPAAENTAGYGFFAGAPPAQVDAAYGLFAEAATPDDADHGFFDDAPGAPVPA